MAIITLRTTVATTPPPPPGFPRALTPPPPPPAWTPPSSPTVRPQAAAPAPVQTAPIVKPPQSLALFMKREAVRADLMQDEYAETKAYYDQYQRFGWQVTTAQLQARELVPLDETKYKKIMGPVMLADMNAAQKAQESARLQVHYHGYARR